MKIKDVKFSSDNRTVGDLVQFLGQFSPSTPIIMRAESDVCSRGSRGYPFFYASVSWATWEEWDTATLPDNTNEGELEVAAVVITVDH